MPHAESILDDKNKDDESLLTIEEMNETGLIDSNLMAVLLLIAYLVMGKTIPPYVSLSSCLYVYLLFCHVLGDVLIVTF